MERRLRLTPGYLRTTRRLGLVAKSIRGRALAGTIAATLSADALPTPSDTKVIFKPAMRAFARRVRGHNLWLWYAVSEQELTLLTITIDPPVPEE